MSTTTFTVPPPYSSASEWAYALRERGLSWLRAGRLMCYRSDDASTMMNARTAARMWAFRNRTEPLAWPLPPAEQDADYATKGETAYTLRLRGLTWLQVARMMDYPQDNDLTASQAACAIAKKWAGTREQPWPIERLLPSGQEVYELRASGLAWAAIQDQYTSRTSGLYTGLGLGQLHTLAVNYAEAADLDMPETRSGPARDPKSIRAYETKTADPSLTWPQVAILSEFPGEDPQRHRAAYQAARRYAVDEKLAWPIKAAVKPEPVAMTPREAARALRAIRRPRAIRRRTTSLPSML